MLGAEANNLNETRTDQFHPATVHCQITDDAIGWIKIHSENMIQAEAKPYKLHLSSKENVKYSVGIRAQGIHVDMIQAKQWNLPNLTVQLQRQDTAYEVKQDADRIAMQFETSEAVRLRFSI